MTYFCLPEKPKRANEKKRKEKRKTQGMCTGKVRKDCFEINTCLLQLSDVSAK